MKINNIGVLHEKINFSNGNKKNKNYLNKKCEKNALELEAAYNVAFCGLFSKKEKPIDATTLLDPHQMSPNKEYIVDENTSFLLNNSYLSLKNEVINSYIKNLSPQDELVFGRTAFKTDSMDDTVSRRHLQITKNKRGQIIAKDLGSSNGTTILANVHVPNLENGEFKLVSGEKYLFPQDAVLAVADIPLILPEYKSVFDNMKEGDSLILGRSEEANIRYFNNAVSKKHLKLQKHRAGIIVTDLNSTNGTKFIGLDSAVNYCECDYSNIIHKTKLQKCASTLLPKDSQLYLGENLTIDIRNKNILDLLNVKGDIVIGRDASCDVIVPSFYDQVSRKHLKLQKHNDRIIATDLNASNDTIVVPKNEIEAFYGGVSDINISQGNVGDCYLLATIYSMSRNPVGQQMLMNMVSVADDGSYIVKFDDSEPIKVALEELDGQKKKDGSEKRSVSGDLGIKAIERAYGKMIKVGRTNPTMFQQIDGGGYMDSALEQMTGLRSIYYSFSFCDMDSILDKISKTGIQKHILTCATPHNGKYDGYVDENRCFINGHAYSIKNIDSYNKRIGIVNPHNTKYTYDISWDEFKQYFSCLYDSYTG